MSRSTDLPDPPANRLSRWSRRKLEAGREETTPEIVTAGDMEASPEQSEELEANRLAAEAVDLGSLTAESDLSVFMKDGVPALLRRRALATLWRSDPVFANTDGLVDYGEDFGRPELVMKTFTSAWKIGSGYLRDTIEQAEQEETAPTAPSKVNEAPPLEDTLEQPAPEPVLSVETEPAPDREYATEKPARPRLSLRHRLSLDTDPAAEEAS